MSDRTIGNRCGKMIEPPRGVLTTFPWVCKRIAGHDGKCGTQWEQGEEVASRVEATKDYLALVRDAQRAAAGGK